MIKLVHCPQCDRKAFWRKMDQAFVCKEGHVTPLWWCMGAPGTKNSEKIGSGIPGVEAKGTTPADIQVSQYGDKNIAPGLCRRCSKHHSVFRSPGHPDDGVTFACGSMIEAWETRGAVYSCGYFDAAPVADVIDSDKANAAIAMVQRIRGRVA